MAPGLLIHFFSLVSAGGLLWVGLDFNGEVDTLLKTLSGLDISDFNVTYIHWTDDQVIAFEQQFIPHLLSDFVNSEHSLFDFHTGVVVQGFEGDGWNVASDSGSDAFAGITYKVFHIEQLNTVFLSLRLFEVPAVGERQRHFGMVSCLHNEDVSHEVRA